MRALAALGVVIHHMQSELAQHGFGDPFPDFEIGAFGVDLFFVISGFIMVYSSDRFFAQPRGAKAFLLKRIVRIVPLYWLFTTLMVIVVVRAARHTHVYPLREFLASYLFIPYPDALGFMIPTYPPGWTLNFEMFFYACFAAALSRTRGIAVGGVAIFLATLVGLGFCFAFPQPLAFWADSLCLEFCYGMGLALLFIAGWRLPGVIRAALAVVGVCTALLLIGHGESSPIRGLAWGVPAAAIIAAAALTDRAPGGFTSRALVNLGDASYSLYLSHIVVFIAIYPLVGQLLSKSSASGFIYGSLAVVGSVAVALLVHHRIEAPITRLLSSWMRRAPVRSQSA